MPKQLELQLFDERQEIYENQSLEDIIYSVKPNIENILEADFLTCPNCESNYIELNGCENCGYGIDSKNKALEYIDEINKEKINIKKVKYETIGFIKFQIPNKNMLFIENREVKIDKNNLFIGNHKAILYITIKKNKYKVECFYETIYQADENHKIDIESAKIIHNLKLKTFDINKNGGAGFDFKADILKQLKFILTVNILNKPKYNKNL